jgi:hypothetical protein
MRARWSRGIVASLILAVVGLAACGDERTDNPDTVNEGLMASNQRLQFFGMRHPAQEIIRWAEADLNDDGQLDLIVMYRADQDHNMMRVIMDFGGSCFETNEVPAPYSDQVIHFRDIDQKPPMEFIVQGARGGKMGFAVFRIEENRLVDLFGEGMRDCC